MHFLGGFGVGMVAIGILRAVYTREKIDISSKFWITILMVFIVGILWEAVELYYKVSVIFGGQLVFDTIKDLLMDVFGGILSYICFHRRLR